MLAEPSPGSRAGGGRREVGQDTEEEGRFELEVKLPGSTSPGPPFLSELETLTSWGCRSPQTLGPPDTFRPRNPREPGRTWGRRTWGGPECKPKPRKEEREKEEE